MLTPRLWVDVEANTYQDIEDSFTGLTYAEVEDESPPISYYSLLDPAGHDYVARFRDGEILSFVQTETISLVEDEVPFVKEFTVVFNDSLTAPGFVVTLRGLLEGPLGFDTIDVFRRDPTGRYADQRVRGLASVNVIENDITVTDYEAPLNVPLEYYLRLGQGSDEFSVGPVLPTPDPFIPTLSEAYAGGTTYLKPIDIPELSRPVMVDTDGLRSWTEPARVLAEHHVLGRRNKVVISDVRGGREGTMVGHCVLAHGQQYDVIEEIVAPGVTVLIQNHNATVSGFPDMYVQVKDISFTRRTQMVWNGERDNPPTPEVIVTFEFEYVQVDRPDPTGVVLVEASWGTVDGTFASWESVNINRETWLNLFQQPVGPDSS